MSLRPVFIITTQNEFAISNSEYTRATGEKEYSIVSIYPNTSTTIGVISVEYKTPEIRTEYSVNISELIDLRSMMSMPGANIVDIICSWVDGLSDSHLQGILSVPHTLRGESSGWVESDADTNTQRVLDLFVASVGSAILIGGMVLRNLDPSPFGEVSQHLNLPHYISSLPDTVNLLNSLSYLYMYNQLAPLVNTRLSGIIGTMWANQYITIWEYFKCLYKPGKPLDLCHSVYNGVASTAIITSKYSQDVAQESETFRSAMRSLDTSLAHKQSEITELTNSKMQEVEGTYDRYMSLLAVVVSNSLEGLVKVADDMASKMKDLIILELDKIKKYTNDTIEEVESYRSDLGIEYEEKYNTLYNLTTEHIKGTSAMMESMKEEFYKSIRVTMEGLNRRLEERIDEGVRIQMSDLASSEVNEVPDLEVRLSRLEREYKVFSGDDTTAIQHRLDFLEREIRAIKIRF